MSDDPKIISYVPCLPKVDPIDNLLADRARTCGLCVIDAAIFLRITLKEGYQDGVECGFIHGFRAAMKLLEKQREEKRPREWKVKAMQFDILWNQDGPAFKEGEQIKVREVLE